VPDDNTYMNTALELARDGLGQVAPNPSVACVLVRGGRIVGTGVTQKNGRPHAETMALADAGPEAAQRAEAYVTLEPCAHHGKTPPCAEALIAAGVARVVSALEDPDPRVAGQGHQRLRDAGIKVDIGIGAEAARAVNIGYFTRLAKGRPFVQLKLAVSEDWKIAAEPGRPTAVTGAQARQATHGWRAHADAVLVGAGTWRADDPALTCREPGLEDRSPIRIVLDMRAELPLDSQLVRSAGDVPLWVVVGEAAARQNQRALEARGARIVVCSTKIGRVDFGELFARLGKEGLTRLLVEGGGQVAQSLIEAGLVDELILLRAAKDLGEKGVPAFGALSPRAALSGFALASEAALGADRCMIYRAEKS